MSRPWTLKQRAERLGRLEQQLAAPGELVEAAHRVALAREVVVDPVAARLVQDRDPRGDRVGQAAADRALDVGGVELAVAQRKVGIEVLAGLLGVELDDARRRVATEQRALRSAQHLDALDVEQRRALQYHVFENDLIHDDGHGLRSRKVEVGVAEAPNIESWRNPAVRRFGIQARHAGRERADVLAALEQRIHALTLERRHRDRHELHVLRAASRGDDDFLELAGLLGLSRPGCQRSGCERLRAGARQRPKRSGFRCQESLPLSDRLCGRAWMPRDRWRRV